MRGSSVEAPRASLQQSKTLEGTGLTEEDVAAREAIKGMSLERKLPLLMTGVLLAILLAGVLLAYREVRRAGDVVITRRVEELARHLASVTSSSRPRLAERLRTVAAHPAVQRVLTTRPPSARDLTTVRGILSSLEIPGDSGLASELRASDGRVIARAGDANSQRDRPATGAVTTGPDSMAMGAFYQSGARVYYWTTMPVTSDGVRIGMVAQRRRLNSQADTESQIVGLSGQEVSILFRNADGALWTTLGGKPVGAPLHPRVVGDLRTYDHPDVTPEGRVLMYEAAVSGTPWVVAIELPTAKLGVGSQDILYRFSLVALVLLLIGALALWIVSRRITSPLAKLTTASDRIARGDYSQRVVPKGDYEIARLGSSFNRMSAEIDVAQRMLKTTAETASQAQKAAEEANAAKGNFLAAMSHELRTPLNAIAGYVELLQMGIRGPLNEAQATDLERIKRSQRYLLGLIEEVLVFTQLDAHQLTFRIEDVHVDAVMRDAETMVEPQIRARGIRYSYDPCDPALTVHADREKTQQIVLNLLANSAKYTEPGGEVAVSCVSHNFSVQVRVTDTGVGIPPDMLNDIFEPFVQAGRRLNQPRDGVGLGLTISRDLARAMGGDLIVESALGVGSTFTLELPRREQPLVSSSAA